MKIIDDKGKLFGLINIIDLSIILILIASVMVLRNANMELHKPKYDYEKIYRIKVIYPNVLTEVADAIKVGDEQKGSAKIVDVERADIKSLIPPEQVVKSYGAEGGNGLGYYVIAKLIVTYRVRCFVKNDVIYNEGQYAMKIGHPFVFDTRTYVIEGSIVSIEED